MAESESRAVDLGAGVVVLGAGMVATGAGLRGLSFALGGFGITGKTVKAVLGGLTKGTAAQATATRSVVPSVLSWWAAQRAAGRSTLTASQFLKQHRAALIGKTAATRTATIAQRALNFVMRMNPWALAAIAVVALGALIFGVITNWDAIKARFGAGLPLNTSDTRDELEKVEAEGPSDQRPTGRGLPDGRRAERPAGGQEWPLAARARPSTADPERGTARGSRCPPPRSSRRNSRRARREQ